MSDPFARFRLDGRTAFVSGAGRHLGMAMAETLARAGADVIVNGRSPEPVKALAARLREEGHACRSAVFDVGDIDAVRGFFSSLPRLDILVNNAVSMNGAAFGAVEPDAFATTFRSAVTGAFEAARSALPGLRSAVAAAGEASIINIASMYGVVAPKPHLYSSEAGISPPHYSAAKAALIQLTRHLAAELGPQGIRVNALVPGPFPRPEVRERDPAFAARLAEQTMLGRLGVIEDITGPLLFLASSASSYMTGAALMLDGGWTAW